MTCAIRLCLSSSGRGAHPKYIQEQAGHSSIQVTMDTYGHLFPSQNREWVNELDDAVILPASYPQPLEAEQPEERRTDKPLDSEEDLVVAVKRTIFNFGPKIRVPLRHGRAAS